ncbi:MAG: gamma-glutamylcyclotransferase [Segetibacter sp.]|jgi:gamma-glutamylcyclotransferase (GGCT)/AIG2-like uncharacterized protein YtfP|nr:gamma-glutamylcyclotransferase [Segetibacter sp.]
MKNIVTKLFVYGTLRKGFHHEAYEYISKHFSLLGDAKVKGKLFDLGEYPAAIPTSDDFFIKGELYDLKEAGEFDWAIEQLDDYEGLNPEEGETKLYSRELAEVFHNDQSSHAWIYWYNRQVSGQPQILSGDIFDHITAKPQL